MEKNIGTDKEISFEAAMVRLEEIVGKLEGGKVSLDASLELYEEGIALVRFCSDTLDKAEKKIKIVKTGSDGTKTEEDFQ